MRASVSVHGQPCDWQWPWQWLAMAMAATFDRLVSWLSLGKPSVLVYNTGGVTQTFAALHTHTVRAAPRLLTPATSAPGPGSPPPHLNGDRAHPLPRRSAT